jgi:hypothetical protein
LALKQGDVWWNSLTSGRSATVRHLHLSHRGYLSGGLGFLMLAAFSMRVARSTPSTAANNKLVRRGYWLDMNDRSLVMVMTQGIGAHLINDEKRADT